MKKTMLIVLVMAFCGMYWVSAAEKPAYSWIDPNQVDGDKVHPIMLMAGQAFTVESEESQEGVGVLYTAINPPDDATIDVNTEGRWSLTWRPMEPGIYYLKVHLLVTEPYPGGDDNWTVAVLVRDIKRPMPIFWHFIHDD